MISPLVLTFGAALAGVFLVLPSVGGTLVGSEALDRVVGVLLVASASFWFLRILLHAWPTFRSRTLITATDVLVDGVWVVAETRSVSREDVVAVSSDKAHSRVVRLLVGPHYQRVLLTDVRGVTYAIAMDSRLEPGVEDVVGLLRPTAP